MTKMAFIFPGQASQYVGMAQDIFDEFSSVREIFEKASDILDLELAHVCFGGPEEELKQTIYTQPAVFVHSCAIQMILRENYIRPVATAGHSLGEYSALVASGALSFESAIKAIGKRSAAMQADCDNSPGAMAAIMGLPYEKIIEVLKEIDGIVVPANFNSAEEIVISGEQAAVETACANLKEAGAKLTKMLPVAGAYHSPLMNNSAEMMRDYIMQMDFGAFDFPVYANVSSEPLSSGQPFKELLARQITSPVLWYPTMQNIYRDGIRKIIEIGPGKVLQKLAKRSFDDPALEISGIDTLDDLDKFMNDYAKAGANEPG